MSLSDFFEELGAPLCNNRWSWGAVHSDCRIVFLRVWQEGTRRYKDLGGDYYTWVSDVDMKDQSLGANERRAHIDLIRQGYKCYLIMCQWADNSDYAKVGDFDKNDLFLAGELVEHENAILIKNLARIPTRDVKNALLKLKT